MSRWRKAYDHQRCVGITKSGHSPTPVRFIAERSPFLTGDLLAPLDEPRTLSTVLNVNPQLVQCIHAITASF